MAHDRRITIPPWCVTDAPSLPGPMSPRVQAEKVPPVSDAVAIALMTDIVALCERHGVWLAHEDNYGAFMVQRTPTRNWLMAARGTEHDALDEVSSDDRQEYNDE